MITRCCSSVRWLVWKEWQTDFIGRHSVFSEWERCKHEVNGSQASANLIINLFVFEWQLSHSLASCLLCKITAKLVKSPGKIWEKMDVLMHTSLSIQSKHWMISMLSDCTANPTSLPTSLSLPTSAGGSDLTSSLSHETKAAGRRVTQRSKCLYKKHLGHPRHFFWRRSKSSAVQGWKRHFVFYFRPFQQFSDEHGAKTQPNYPQYV